MKSLIHQILLASLLFIPGLTLAQDSVQQAYQAGVKAYQEENWALAVKLLQDVHRKTGNPRVEFYLRNARMRMKAGEPSVSLESKLRQILIPQVSFEEADLETVFAYLTQKTRELSQGKVNANFIYKGTRDERTHPHITLQLSNVPVADVISYVGQLSNTSFKYEKFAVVGTPTQLALPTVPEPVSEPSLF
ncbi:MAG: hypothetical protein AAGJ31_00120 [Verrucomicrobiota bacterium]